MGSWNRFVVRERRFKSSAEMYLFLRVLGDRKISFGSANNEFHVKFYDDPLYPEYTYMSIDKMARIACNK